MANDSGIWREAMDERRPDYILAIRARALDRVQDLIEPHENDDVPPPDVWRRIVDAAFPPPPMAGRSVSDDPSESIFSAQWTLDEYAVARGRGGELKIGSERAYWREPEWPPAACAKCGKPFKTGELIEANSPDMAWMHSDCPDTRRISKDDR